MIRSDGRRSLYRLRQQFVANPVAAEPGHGDAQQSHIEHFLNVRRVQDRHQQVFEQQFGVPGGDGGGHVRIIARQDQHTAVFGGAMPVALPDGVQAAVHAGPLAVPHAVDAVVVGIVEIMDLLRTPQCSGCQVFIQAGPELDVMIL